MFNDEPVYVNIDEEIVQGTNGTNTELTVSHQAFATLKIFAPDSIPDLSDEAVELGVSLAPRYYEGFIQAGDFVRAVYNGMTFIKSRKNVAPGQPPKEIETVVFQNRDGMFLHSGANLVNQLRGYPTGKAIQITFTGEEKTGSGNKINKFDVRVLNIKNTF